MPELGYLEVGLADPYTSEHLITMLNTMDGNWIPKRVHGRMILEALPGPLIFLQMTQLCSSHHESINQDCNARNDGLHDHEQVCRSRQ